MSDLVLGIRLTADGKDLVGAVKVSAAEIDKLGGATKRAASESEKLNAQQKSLGESLNSVASRIGAYTIGWNVAVDAITSAARAIKDYIKEAALLNTRHETMGVVLEVVGRNAGYSKREMDAYAESVRKTGITMIASRENIVKMVQANLDLASAGKLARVAQDAAYIANINSSEAFTRLIYGIQSGQTEMLRTMGINVNFEASYKKLAAQLKVTTEQLTEQEKTQARANVVFEASTRIAGTYEAAMGTVGKKMSSLARYTEDLKTMRGEVFNEMLVIAVDTYTDALKDANSETRQLALEGKLKEWGRDAIETFAFVGDAVAGAWGVIAQAVESTAVVVLQSLNAISQATLLLPMGALTNWAAGDPAGKLSAFTGSFTGVANENLAARLARPQLRDTAAQFFAQKDADAAARAARQVTGDEWLTFAKDRPAQAARPAGTSGAGSDPYPAMLKSLKEKLLVERELTEVNKLQLSLDAMTAKQRAQISPAEQATLVRTAAQVDAQKLNNAAIENTAKNEEALAKARAEGAAAQAAFDKQRDDAILAAYKNLDQMEFEVTLIGMTNEGRERAIALRTLETSGIDKQSFAYTDLKKRIEDALGSKAAADKQKQFAEDMQRAHVSAWQAIDRTAHDTFVSIFDSGKSVFDRLRDTLKNGLYSLLYQMTLKKWIINISGSVSGAGVAQSAFGASGGGLDLLSSASNLAGAAGLFGSAGAYAAAVPGLTSAAAGSQAAMLAAQTGAFGAQGLAMTAASGGSALGGGFSTAMAAIPGWGWAALGAAAIGAYLLSGEDERVASPQMSGLDSTSTIGRGGFSGRQWVASGTSPSDLWAGSQFSGLAEDALVGFNKAIAGVFADAEKTARQLGLDTSALASITVTMGQTGQGVQADMAAALQMTADTIALSLMPSIKDLQQSGETLAQTFGRLAAAQAALDNQRLTMEIQLMKLQGKTVEALAATRKRELAALDSTLRALQQQIYAAEDLAVANAAAVRAQQDATRAAEDAARAAGDVAKAQADVTAALRDSLSSLVNQGRAVRDFLNSLGATGISMSLAAARSVYLADLAGARAGDASAYDRITKSAGDYITAGESYSTSGNAQRALVAQVKAELGNLQPVVQLDQSIELLKLIDASTQSTAISTKNLDVLGIKAIFDLSQTISFVADATGVPEDLRKLITDEAKEYQVMLTAAFAEGVSGPMKKVLLDGAGIYAATVNAALGTIDEESRALALTASGTYLATVNAAMGLADDDAAKLALTAAGSYLATVQAALGEADPSAKSLALNTANTLAATVTAALGITNSDALALALNKANTIAADVSAALGDADETALALALGNAVTLHATVTAGLATDAATTEAVALIRKQQWDAAFVAAAGEIYASTGTYKVPYETYDDETEEYVTAYRDKFDLAAYDAAVAAWKLANPMPAFARGGLASGWSLVGEEGPELANFTQPARIYTADQTRAAMGGAANGELLAEIKALRKENALIAQRLDSIDKHSRRTADTIVRVTRDGESMLTEAA